MPLKAVIFDFIGTLVNCRDYNMVDSEAKLYSALISEGFDIEKDRFLVSYKETHQKYRKVRYEQFREVTNAVWVSEALCNLGFKVTPENRQVKTALNVFFQDFLDTLELRRGAKQLLNQISQQYRVGLISNFTHAPVIHKGLRKIGIHNCFNAVVISQDVKWRKPSPRIFCDTLIRLGVQAHEAVFIGDSPTEDIGGAKEAGLKTVFIPSQFNSLDDLAQSKQAPDGIVERLESIPQKLRQIFVAV
ncbi:MAG: HAD family hydrolase [Nitrososphaerota archaeon]|jgi:putative hydrolase of the HAD superfamily|uniref:HAD family hydrolase n=1 Tax=Candidatus Bathycorpusculum sp. TaxID=2994959 RepID=UPI00281C1808|nr:HAD family hydrolase [Candidatus Termitimicrobium sp.]MCL2431392.1 HAD family hydrolase [Candidatus Termitimicrobium sp.]MDR0493987.1 HAD family hydrolase [Nitrososphaerota archaeon]